MIDQPTKRERLTNRRGDVTDCARWPSQGGRRVHVSAGFSNDGRVLEVFLAGGGKAGSESNLLLADIAVILSRLLQHGDTLADIAVGLV
jgi:hypothetical protein